MHTATHSLPPTHYHSLLTPYSPLPTPHSPLPTPHSLLPAGERNYHVFYQLLAGLTAAELAELHLDAPLETFSLVNQSGCVSIPGQDEAVEFGRTRTAMEAVGLVATEQRETTRAVGAVLLLAQLAFEPDEEVPAPLACPYPYLYPYP